MPGGSVAGSTAFPAGDPAVLSATMVAEDVDEGGSLTAAGDWMLWLPPGSWAISPPGAEHTGAITPEGSSSSPATPAAVVKISMLKGWRSKGLSTPPSIFGVNGSAEAAPTCTLQGGTLRRSWSHSSSVLGPEADGVGVDSALQRCLASEVS